MQCLSNDKSVFLFPLLKGGSRGRVKFTGLPGAGKKDKMI